jgi:integrase/recombinase XerD
VSALRKLAEDYLAIRRTLGFKLKDPGRLVIQFVDYLEEVGATSITTEQALAWLRLRTTASPFRQRQRLAAVREFARYVQSIDAQTEVPSKALLPIRLQRRAPYLYSEDEIAQLMAAARSIESPLHAATFDTLIGLLAVTGMRLGEALGLDRPDVDLTTQLIVVRCGKFNKPRQVPIHLSTAKALHAYSQLRDRLCPRPKCASFFVSSRRGRLSRSTVHAAFARLRDQTGLGTTRRSRPPRLHDLRHTFVLRTLLNWYQAGIDVQAQLPLLSTYLGHVDPKSTYWYFQAAPELLALAAERLEYAWGSQP